MPVDPPPEFNWPGVNQSSPDHPMAVRLADGTIFDALSINGVGAFGDVVTGELHPEVQIDFVYGVHEEMATVYTTGTGSVEEADSMAILRSGAGIGGGAHLRTIRACHYRPGLGSLFRWTALYGAHALGVGLAAGVFTGEAAKFTGGSENAIFAGYDPETDKFGWCRLHAGKRDVHTLTLTVPAAGAETLTVTLNGVAVPVPLTAGSVEENAQEIAEVAFAGWQAEPDGAHVHFIANAAEAREGAYTVSSTGAADGAYVQNTVGADANQDWAYQEDWNRDKLNGKGYKLGNPSGMDLDHTKGNVYAVSLQFLGFGPIDCMIVDPISKKFLTVHRFEYSNKHDLPSLSDPTLHLGMAIENVTAALDTTVKMASAAAFVEGTNRVLGPPHGVLVEGAAAAQAPVLSIRCNNSFVDGTNRVNLRDLVPLLVSIAGSGSNKPIKAFIVLNGALSDPLWLDYDSSHSFAAVDISATAVSGGDVIFGTGFSSGGSAAENLLDLDIDLHPGDVISVVIEPTGTPVDYTASLSWKEDA